MARRYSNLNPHHRPHGAGAILRWGVLDRLAGKRRGVVGEPAPRVEPDLSFIDAPDHVPRVTWIGHSSFLASFGSSHVLLDPVFSDRIASVVRRHCPPGLQPDRLPPLVAALVTHCHYDHLDRPSVEALPAGVPLIVPRGVGGLMRGWGRERIVELDWWESTDVEGARVTLVPARHWSRRRLFDTNATLWGGYVIETDLGAVYHAGDSAWFDGFAAIGQRFPGLLAAMLPIGGYDPPWFMEQQHMNPEQAGDAFLSLGAHHLLPMHWGTFRLTDEPFPEPLERMRAWWEARVPAGRSLHCLSVGETVALERAP